MAGRKSDFTLTKLDDLFTTQAQRDEEQLSKIRDIPLELIDDFPDHPFKVRDDEDMMQLVESVKERGVITPATVRQKEDGRYELVSGHRRTPSHDQTIRMRKLFNEGNLTTEAIHAVMSEEKPNQKEKIVLRGDRVRQLIPKNIPVSQTEDFVCKALEHYNKFLRNRAERDSR